MEKTKELKGQLKIGDGRIVKCVNCLKTRRWFSHKNDNCPFCGSRMMEFLGEPPRLSKKQKRREDGINKLVDNMCKNKEERASSHN